MAPPLPVRKAWPGGKIVVSNKDEVVLRFLQKKRTRGESLTDEQLSLLAKYHTPQVAAVAAGGIIDCTHSDAEDAAPKPHSGVKRKDKDRKDSTLKQQHGPAAKRGRAVSATPTPASPSIPVTSKLGMSLDSLVAKSKGK